MKYVKLSDNLTISRILWGFWRWADWGISIPQLEKTTFEVLERGITTLDFANIYANGEAEISFGKVMKSNPSLRSKIQIIDKATQVYKSDQYRVKHYNTSSEHLISEVEKSLHSLNTDYLDLFLLHRPDPFMNPEEVADAFEKLHKSGKVLNFGVSNYKPLDYDLLESYTDIPLVSNQFEASVLCHENFDDRTVKHAQMKRIHPIIWSPLAGGKIFTSEDEVTLRVKAELEIVREELGVSQIDLVALAWLLNHPAEFSTITGACDLEYIQRAIDSVDVKLTRVQWFAIWSAYVGRRVL